MRSFLERKFINENREAYDKGFKLGAGIGAAGGALVVGGLAAPTIYAASATYASELSLTAALRFGMLTPIGLKATQIATSIANALADTPDYAFGRAGMQRTAALLADVAASSGRNKGAAAALMTRAGQISMGVSGETVRDNPKVLGLLMSLKPEARIPQAGRCAEISAIEKALSAGADLEGAVMGTVSIGNGNKSKFFSSHGSFKPACPACEDVMKSLSITH